MDLPGVLVDETDDLNQQRKLLTGGHIPLNSPSVLLHIHTLNDNVVVRMTDD
jgi:hypothetical protein